MTLLRLITWRIMNQEWASDEGGLQVLISILIELKDTQLQNIVNRMRAMLTGLLAKETPTISIKSALAQPEFPFNVHAIVTCCPHCITNC